MTRDQIEAAIASAIAGMATRPENVRIARLVESYDPDADVRKVRVEITFDITSKASPQ